MVPNLVFDKDDEQVDKSITIAYVDYKSTWNENNTFYLTALLTEFSCKHPNIPISPITFDSQDSFLSWIVAELTTGKGPDVLLLDNFSTINWNKMAINHQLTDLSQYMSVDNAFHRENYFSAALNAGVLEEKQYVLPLSFKCSSFFSSERKLCRNANKTLEIESYNDILNLINMSVEHAKMDSERFPIVFNTSTDLYLASLLEAFQVPIIDVAFPKIVMSKNILADLCDCLRSLNEVCSLNENNYRLTDCIYQSISFPSVDYYFQSYGLPVWIAFQNFMMEYVNEKAVTILTPSFEDGKKHAATLSFYGAVNNNSKQKDYAYKTLRTLADEACGEGIGWDFPANRKALEEWIDKQVAGKEWTITIDDVPHSIIHADHYGTQLMRIADNISIIPFNDWNALKIIDDGMMPYIHNTMNFEECYYQVINELNLYISK